MKDRSAEIAAAQAAFKAAYVRGQRPAGGGRADSPHDRFRQACLDWLNARRWTRVFPYDTMPLLQRRQDGKLGYTGRRVGEEGVSDIIGFRVQEHGGSRVPVFLAVEVKIGNDTLTDAQREFIACVRGAHGIALAAYAPKDDPEDVSDLERQWKEL